jgi:hypothetical protein
MGCNTSHTKTCGEETRLPRGQGLFAIQRSRAMSRSSMARAPGVVSIKAVPLLCDISTDGYGPIQLNHRATLKSGQEKKGE